MKHAFYLLLFLAGAALASDVLLFDPVSSPVPGRGVSFVRSQDTGKYAGATNALINPTLPDGVPIHWLKVTNGAAVVMSASESNSIVSAESSALLAAEKEGAKETYDSSASSGRLQRAFAVVLLNEINNLRTNQVPPLPARTPAQVRNAIRN